MEYGNLKGYKIGCVYKNSAKNLLNFMEILGTIFMAIILLFRVQLERDIPLWFTVSFFCIVIPLITVNLLISKKLREM